MEEYFSIIREFKSLDAFQTCLKDEVIPSITNGASVQTNICAYRGETLCGTLSFAMRGAITFVWGLYVAPRLQRSGVGANLIQTLCNTSDCATTLSLQVMEESEKAIQFYRKCGFQITERITAEVFPNIWRPIYVMQVPSDQCLQNLRGTA